MQKVLRVVALFLFVMLILSPIYGKHMKKYFEEVLLVENDIKNISQILDVENKLCSTTKPIKIPANDNTIQILHIMSTKCKACIEDSEVWKEFPHKLYEALTNKKKKIQIINLVDNVSFQFSEWENVMTKLVNHTSNEKLSQMNIDLCFGVIDQNILQTMRLNIFPSTIVLKNREIEYISYGAIDRKDMRNLINSLTSIS
jgi:hypothetical protein